jgi:hypothetical protein
MTRASLCGLLAALTILLGLATAVVQSANHERGQALNALKEECSMIEAVNGDRAERILVSDWGPLPLEAPAVDDAAAPRIEGAP